MPVAIGSGAIGAAAITGNPPAGQRGKFIAAPRFRVRILDPVSGAVVIDKLAFVALEYENIFPQAGMAGSSTIGHFVVHLYHPMTDEYAWNKVWYDKLDQMQRVEIYMVEDPDGTGATGDPVFTGVVENLPKEDFSYRIEGSDSLKLLDLSRTLQSDTFTDRTDNMVRYALKAYQMTKGEDWTGTLGAYTNDGTWALTTDQGFSSVKNGSGGDGLLFTTASYTNAQYADCFVEAPYHLTCPTGSSAEAGVVANVTDSNNLVMGRALMRYVNASRYEIDAEIWLKSGGSYTRQAVTQAVVVETTQNAIVTVTLVGTQVASSFAQYTWRLLVNEIDSKCQWVQNVTTGAPTGGVGLRATFTAGTAVVQHHLVFMSKANIFQPGNIAVGVRQVNQPIASQQNIDLLSLAASTEGCVWAKRPKPGLNQDQIDFALSTGSDLSGIVRFEQDQTIVSSQSERNAEPLNTAVLAAGHPAYNHVGHHRWYDITAINRRGLVMGSAVMPQTSDLFALRQMAQNVLLNRKQPTQAKRMTVLRHEDHAELPGRQTPTGMAYRDGDWVVQHEPRKGINYQRVQIMSCKVTSGIPTMELTLDQYPVMTDRMPLIDRMNRVIEAAQTGRSDASIKDPATGISYNRRLVLPINPWKMRAYLLNNQTVAGFTGTQVAFDTISYDNNSTYNLTSHVFVAPIGGDYAVSGTLLAIPPAGGGGTSYIDIRDIDTVTVLAAGADFNSPANASAGAGLFDIIPLIAGQRIGIFFVPGTMAVGSWVIQGGSPVFTYFTVHLLSG